MPRRIADRAPPHIPPARSATSILSVQHSTDAHSCILQGTSRRWIECIHDGTPIRESEKKFMVVGAEHGMIRDCWSAGSGLDLLRLSYALDCQPFGLSSKSPVMSLPGRTVEQLENYRVQSLVVHAGNATWRSFLVGRF